ncbi:hypothetical protein PUN28_003377 [Cardiocondyla obscurior]|uniref:Uncharacterized protein n=1 Tax=Cardiocondyla obscurior TaxID=286306 RepID=A0AAW2GK80_9HYME
MPAKNINASKHVRNDYNFYQPAAKLQLGTTEALSGFSEASFNNADAIGKLRPRICHSYRNGLLRHEKSEVSRSCAIKNIKKKK